MRPNVARALSKAFKAACTLESGVIAISNDPITLERLIEWIEEIEFAERVLDICVPSP